LPGSRVGWLSWPGVCPALQARRGAAQQREDWLAVCGSTLSCWSCVAPALGRVCWQLSVARWQFGRWLLAGLLAAGHWLAGGLLVICWLGLGAAASKQLRDRTICHWLLANGL